MRHILILLCLFSFLAAGAQEVKNTEIQLLIACGFAGSTSPEVTNIQELVYTGEYSTLKKRLFSSNKAEMILSAVAIKQLESMGTVTLTKDEKQKNSEISSRKDPYSICYTCTEHFTGTVNELLNDSNSPAYVLISRKLVNCD